MADGELRSSDQQRANGADKRHSGSIQRPRAGLRLLTGSRKQAACSDRPPSRYRSRTRLLRGKVLALLVRTAAPQTEHLH